MIDPNTASIGGCPFEPRVAFCTETIFSDQALSCVEVGVGTPSSRYNGKVLCAFGKENLNLSVVTMVYNMYFQQFPHVSGGSSR